VSVSVSVSESESEIWTLGHWDIGTFGHSDIRTFGHSDIRTLGHSDIRAFGHWDMGRTASGRASARRSSAYLGAERRPDQVSDGHGAHEGRETGIFALLLHSPLLKYALRKVTGNLRRWTGESVGRS